MDYKISRISIKDQYAQEQLLNLLEKEGLKKDKNLELIIGVYDEDKLLATGASFKNTLRCIAVDSDYKGEGLMNIIVGNLLTYQQKMGYSHSFIYTKKGTSKFFQDLGFYKIVEFENIIFLENKKNGFENYTKQLIEESQEHMLAKEKINRKENCKTISAIVLNANPFTLGHQYLIEQASKNSELLHIFIVSDNSSFFPFAVREKLVKEGTKHLDNIVYHSTSDYLISSATFPAYFLKEELDVIKAQASLDIEIFKKIATLLNITTRYIGEEPFSLVTNLYNQIMEKELELSGIKVKVIKRKEKENQPISASKVRELIKEENYQLIKELVPELTYNYLLTKEAQPIIKKIKETKEVTHY